MSKSTSKSNQVPVLVVDDDHDVCEFFLDLYEEMGIPVNVVTSGSAGLKEVISKSYELIFLDIKLGDRNGLDILEGIRKVDQEVTIIMISGYLTETNLERALKSGANGYLYKPLQIRDIMGQTMKYLNDWNKIPIHVQS